MEIRDARPDDAAGIAAIYNDAVVSTTAVWNEDTVDEENRTVWLAACTGAGFPVLVAEDGGEVVAYATFGQRLDLVLLQLTLEERGLPVDLEES